MGTKWHTRPCHIVSMAMGFRRKLGLRLTAREPSMPFISLNTAISLTGLSRRTLWRRIADGSLRTRDGGEPGERTQVAVADVLALARLRLAAEDEALVIDADAGDPAAQCDLALLFLEQDMADEAVRWLERAAQRRYPEAMLWLGRCAIAGRGLAADARAGIGWIGRAAERGHLIAEGLLRHLDDPARPPLSPAALDAELDAIEREAVLQALAETAERA